MTQNNLRKSVQMATARKVGAIEKGGGYGR